ncbi:MAG TPA: sulfite exporter TauE/SafE family protein [Xanthobacteraceae bacterium]|jgi:hypothetical protein|nr:sulfite exporter TauE/SafE family protein [Xanthobacteraceae bacterium]
MDLLLVCAAGLFAGTVSGIVGTGSSVILVPILVIAFGPKQAVPIMAIAALIANVSRIIAWPREVDWRAAAVYAATAAPAAALGAGTLLVLPSRLVDGVLGAFFIAMIGIRRFLAAHALKARLPHLALFGAPIGFLTGIVASTGPLSVPLFLAYGLVKGAFLSTEAAGALAVYVSKTAVFRSFGALPWQVILQGLIVGASLMIGTFIAKPFVQRLGPQHFRWLMDGIMLVSGIVLLWTAFH